MYSRPAHLKSNFLATYFNVVSSMLAGGIPQFSSNFWFHRERMTHMCLPCIPVDSVEPLIGRHVTLALVESGVLVEMCETSL